MATGDILSVTILNEGWQAQVVVEGYTTYASFANGMGGPFANDPVNTAIPPGNPTLTLNVTSLGFDATGAATTVTRKVYGTIPIRNVWDANRDDIYDNESTDGTNLTVIFALSDNVYAKDKAGVGNSGVDITADFLAGWLSGVAFFTGYLINAGYTGNSTQAIFTHFGDAVIPANKTVLMGGVTWTFPATPTKICPAFSCTTVITVSGTYTLYGINGPVNLKAGQRYGTGSGFMQFTVAADVTIASGAGTAVAITVVAPAAFTPGQYLGAIAILNTAGTTTTTVTPFLGVGSIVTQMAATGIMTSNAVSGIVVVNNSGYAYPNAVGNWSWAPSRTLPNGDSHRVVAFSHYGHDGKPCACVKITLTDQHAHTETVTVTDMTIDPTLGDAVPVSEYIAIPTMAAMTPLDVITANFKAYPWIGDTDAILDTSVPPTIGHPQGTPEPTAYAGPKTFIYDPTNTHNPYVAVVSSLGNDATGVAQTTLAAAELTPFRTIAGAIGLLVGSTGLFKATKDNLGRSDVSGATIYLRTGNHAWMGGTPYATGATLGATWLKIQNYPGESPVISSQSGGTWWAATVGTKIKFRGISWAIGGSTIIFNTSFTAMAWFDQCTLNLTYTAAMYTMGYVILTRNTMVSFSGGYGGRPACLIMARGNTYNTLPSSQFGLVSLTILGNKKVSPNNNNFGIPGYCPTTLYCGALLSKVGTGSGPVTITLSATSPIVIPKGSPIYFRTAGSPLPIVGYITMTADITAPAWPATVTATIDFRPIYGASDIPYDIPAWGGVAANQAGQGAAYGSTYATTEYSTNVVIAYNRWMSANYGNLMVNFFQGPGPDLHGSALVQNMLESLYGSNPALQHASDGTFLSPIDNLIVWHNTVVGNRCNGPYNTVGDAPAWRRKWSYKNNAFDGLNIKADEFGGQSVSVKNNIAITVTGVQTINLYGPNGYNTDVSAGTTFAVGVTFNATILASTTVGIDPTPGGGTPVSVNVTTLTVPVAVDTTITGSGESGTRIGNWSALYGVNCEGLYNPQVQLLNAFLREWIGLRSFQAGDSPPNYYVFRRNRSIHPSLVTLGTNIVAADVGTLKTISLYTINPLYSSNNLIPAGTEVFAAGDCLSTAQVVTNVNQLVIVFQGPVSINATPQNVQVRVLAAPASVAAGTGLAYPYYGDIRCTTAVANGASPTSLFCHVPYGTLVIPDGTLLHGADGTLQVTVDPGHGLTLNQTPQELEVTTVIPQGTGSVARNQVAGEWMFSPAAYASWGNGDYHPNVGSPLLVGSRVQLLPYDITGSPRPIGFQISGAYIANVTTAEAKANT